MTLPSNPYAYVIDFIRYTQFVPMLSLESENRSRYAKLVCETGMRLIRAAVATAALAASSAVFRTVRSLPRRDTQLRLYVGLPHSSAGRTIVRGGALERRCPYNAGPARLVRRIKRATSI